MIETFSATVNQVLTMFVFMLLGYLFKKKNIGGDGVGSALSAVVVNISLPALSFYTFSQNFNISAISSHMPFLIAGMITMIATFFISKGLAKMFAKDGLQQDIYMYSFLIPNIGYMGYPIVAAVFGDGALLSMMIYTIPFNIMIYTYGIYILNPNREWSIKKILNPNIIAIIIGIAFGLSGMRLPVLAENIVVSAKACMSPLAMILTGFVLASIPLKPVFLDMKSYIAAFIRAVIIPMSAFLLLLLFDILGMLMIIIVATLSMPFGLNIVVFPEAFGGDSKTGAKTCFISNIMSIITIPVVFSIISVFL